MLSRTETLLVAAAVDGELTPAEAAAFARLLAANPAAARLYRRLRAAADRLSALPRHPAPRGTVAAVMARVRPATPARKLPARGRSPLGYLVAASVLLAVAAGSFLFFRQQANHAEQAQADALPLSGAPSVVPAAEAGEPLATVKVGSGERGTPKPSGDDMGSAKLPPVEPPPTTVVQVPKPMTPAEKELYGVGLLIESKPLKQIDPVLPVLFTATDFDKDEPQAKLKAELGKGGGFKLNLSSKSPAAAMDHLQTAARAAGVNVHVEAVTAERLKMALPVAYAFHVENLTADELAALLAALATAVNAQTKPEAILGAAHLIPADAPEQKELKDLLGLDWTAAKGGKGADGKPISDGTLKEVVASVKKGEKAAVVLTAGVKSAKAAEVKQFLDQRGERTPGSVPLLIVVKPQP